MLGVFGRSIAKQPEELNLPSVNRPNSIKTKEDVAQYYLSCRKDTDNTFYNFPGGNFMALSTTDESPPQPRSIVVTDDIFCIFFGGLDNIIELGRLYVLPERATEAMVMVAAYRVLRDRAPYPPDQVLKIFQGKYAFMLFDSKNSVLFLARDREGGGELHWGTAADGSLVCCDDSKIIAGVCGYCYTPFPPGCLLVGANGLINFDHPLHKMKAIEHKDDNGKIRAVIFQADLHTELHSISRTGSGKNLPVTITAKAERGL